MTKLDTRPSRQLTSREAATILGATVGGLVQTAGMENARTAVLWWAENWELASAQMQQAIEAHPDAIAKPEADDPADQGGPRRLFGVGCAKRKAKR